jgi:multisubunit Na+/H+ antiporter MnhG subunit
MSDPLRRQVRVRRAPKVGVFLLIGAVLGALVAIVAVNVTPPDATVPRIQTIGFLILLLAPVGALLLGVVALVLDRIAERRARTVEVELIESARSSPSAVRPEEAGSPDPSGAAASEEEQG